jgi:ABC-type phosphate transport system substrate-binding protein
MMRYSISGSETKVRSRSGTLAVTLVGLVLVGTLTACSSTKAQPATTSSSGTSGIPTTAFSDITGLSPTSVTVGNVSTLAFGLFKGANIGTQAWSAYVNSTGGINGRKILVDSYDDGYQGAPNKQETEQVAQKDFAAVGGFTLEDAFGATVLATNPAVPNVTVSLSQVAGDLPNSFSYRMADRPAALFQAEVPFGRAACRRPRRRPTVRHHQVGW